MNIEDLDLIKAVGKVDKPILFTTSKEDELTNYHHSEDLFG